MSEEQLNVRAEIMSAISKTDDTKDRAMLMLMLGILERVEKLLDDETGLQMKVLNGLTVRHKTDHEWIAEQREMDCHEICAWAKNKMKEEEDAVVEKKGMWSAARKGLAAELARTVVATGTTVAAVLWAMK